MGLTRCRSKPASDTFAVRLDRAAVQQHEAAREREPDAEAALCAITDLVGLREEIEHAREHGA